MGVVLDFAPVTRLLDVPRKPGRPPQGKQTNVRLPESLLAALDEIGEAHGLDLSAVIRMILNEHYPSHLHRAREIKAARDATVRPTKGGKS